MKIIILILSFAITVFSQSPVPIPNINNITSLAGYWHVNWVYYSQNQYVNPPFICWAMDIQFDSTKQSVGQILYFLADAQQHESGVFVIESFGKANSQWIISQDVTLTIVAIDPVSSSWFTLV